MPLRINHARYVPQWLARLDPTRLGDVKIPLEEVLKGSLYYPASALDDRPVRYLGGFVHSFIYADYAYDEKEVLRGLEVGFRGYRLAGHKFLGQGDLPLQRWRRSTPQRFLDDEARFRKAVADGYVKAPFAIWSVFDKKDLYRGLDGPERFSLLYLCADAVVSYRRLFSSAGRAPKVLAIIQPGSPNGWNYTEFKSADGLFAWEVLSKGSRAVPRYLVCGGNGLVYQEAFWPEDYPELVEWFEQENSRGNGIWRHRSWRKRHPA